MYLRMWRTSFLFFSFFLLFWLLSVVFASRVDARHEQIGWQSQQRHYWTGPLMSLAPPPLQCCPQTLTWIKEYNGPLRRQFHNLCWLVSRKAPPSPSVSYLLSLQPPHLFSSFTRSSSPSSCPPAGSRRRVKPAWTHCDCHSGTD